jgi:hypothetical protein
LRTAVLHADDAHHRVNIDAAGNVWTCNNWKPSFDNDLFGDPFTGTPGNSGGDGLLIFVGLAKPL